MDRCNELCMKDTTGVCTLCGALAERDRFERRWFKGGLFRDGAHAMRRRGVFTLLHRYAFPLCFLVLGGLLHLWFARRATGPYFVHENAVFVVVLGISLGVPLLWLLLWWLPQWQVAAVPEDKDRIDLETKSRQTMAQILGGAALLGGLFFTAQTLRISQEGLQVNQETLRVNQQTLRTTQEGQITERFTKAIDQLGKSGNDNLAVRLGGIYALERIARDSAKDHEPIMEVLTAFVREQTHVQQTTPDKPPPAAGESSGQERAKVSADIQAILTVIGRRTRTYGKGESQFLDFRGAHLEGADLIRAHLEGANLLEAHLEGANLLEAHLEGANLRGAHLEGANLIRAHLERANFRGAHLEGAYLVRAHLEDADLREAHLEGAYLREAHLESADLRRAHLEGAYLIRAHLEGANLYGAQLKDANLVGAQLKGADLSQDQINTACVDEHTTLPEGLTRPAPCPIKP